MLWAAASTAARLAISPVTTGRSRRRPARRRTETYQISAASTPTQQRPARQRAPPCVRRLVNTRAAEAARPLVVRLRSRRSGRRSRAGLGAAGGGELLRVRRLGGRLGVSACLRLRRGRGLRRRRASRRPATLRGRPVGLRDPTTGRLGGRDPVAIGSAHELEVAGQPLAVLADEVELEPEVAGHGLVPVCLLATVPLVAASTVALSLSTSTTPAQSTLPSITDLRSWSTWTTPSVDFAYCSLEVAGRTGDDVVDAGLGVVVADVDERLRLGRGRPRARRRTAPARRRRPRGRSWVSPGQHPADHARAGNAAGPRRRARC